MKTFCLLLLLLLMPGSSCLAAERVAPSDATGEINYSLGFQIGEDFQRQGIPFQSEMLVQGIQDALEKSKPLMSRQAMHETLVTLKKQVVAQQLDQRERNLKQEQDFLADNSRKEGVTTLPSGLQYEVLTPGSGPIPQPDSTVRVNYRVTDISGKEFSRKDGGEFVVDKALPGLREALLLMREGAKWRLFIPEKLGYGENTALADRTVILDVELQKILPGA